MFELENTYLKILCDDDTEVNIRRIKRVNLAKFSEKHEKILESILSFNGRIGNFLAVDKNYNLLVELCKLIPVDEEPKFLDFTKIENNYELITLLFFSTSYNPETGNFDLGDDGITYKPSLLNQFNFVEYEELMGKLALKVHMGKMKENKKMREELDKVINA